jgi:CheY-like chemotaxis protein
VIQPSDGRRAAANHGRAGLRSVQNRSRRRVLVVEDDSLVAMLIEDIVADLGHEVVGSATRLEEALDLARTASFDAAILDVNLAGRRSFPVADVLKARGIPFIFATGYDTEGLEEGYRDAVTLHKPFQAEDVKAALAKLMG